MTAEPSPERGRVAFLGLGTMGAAMAANLARAGFSVTGWNRTPGRAPDLADLGVTIAETPAAAVADAGIAVICVSDTPDVEAVLFGPDGVVDGARPGTLIVDCSTIAPSGSWDFAKRLAEHDLAMVDAPVSGGSEGAKNATLTIFVGGEAADVERARPVLAAMGRTITHVGPIGAGQAVKAVNQVILAGAYLGVAEGMVLAIKAGLDVEPGGRGARRRRGPELGPRQSERPDDRQRLPARASRSRSIARTSASPSIWPPSSARSSRSAPSRHNWRPG